MSEWAGMLKDFFRQIEDGTIGLEQMRAIVGHQHSASRAEWQKFYRDVFGIESDFSDLVIPAKRAGFDRLLIVAQGMGAQRCYDKCVELFPCWKWTSDDLDQIVTSDRLAANGSYAIWVRDRVEADEELKNLSANDLKRQSIPGITLAERLLYELKFFKETGGHLDIDSITLCPGSRYSDGNVPVVGWFDGRLDVHWYRSGGAHDNLRSRQVVS